jgi:hypothetical protein
MAETSVGGLPATTLSLSWLEAARPCIYTACMVDTPKPHRRWRLYGLIALFVLVLVAGIVTRQISQKMQRAAKRAEVVEAMLKAGGVVRFDFQLDEDGKRLPKPTSDGPFTVVEAEVRTDDSLKGIENLLQLRHLTLSSRGITDAGLIHLEHLPNLQSLYLEDTQVTEQGIKRLQRALPDCRVSR